MTNTFARPSRRTALGFLSQAALVAGAASTASSAAAPTGSRTPVSEDIEHLKQRLAAAPRRRSFSTVPLVVTSRDDWDYEAAAVVLAYRYRALQVWECTDIRAPWLNLMREAVNGQVFAHGNPGFLAVGAIHGTAHLTLFDQSAWDMYGLASLAQGAAGTNKFITPRNGTSHLDDLQDGTGYYSPENNNIRTLQERGAVFLACHDSIHAIARTLYQQASRSGPDAGTIAAGLTNRLIPDAVLVPSVVAFLVELQHIGFTYAKGD